MSQPALSILFITPDRIARADFSGGSRPKLRDLWHEETAAEDPIMATETALYLGSKAGKKVYVLSTDVWTQTIELPARSVDGLDGEQLNQALSFEIEPISGISSTDSLVGHAALNKSGPQRRYWVSQSSANEVNQIDDAIRRVGSKLAGVLHPAGLSSIGGKHDQARIELWQSTIAGIAPADIDVAATDPRLTDWQASLHEWRGRQISSFEKMAVSDAVVGQNETDWKLLSDESVLAQWLTGCAVALTKSESLPLIKPAQRAMAAKSLGVATLLVCAAVIATCITHFLWLDARRSQADSLSKTLEDRAKKIQSTQKQIEATRKKAKATEDRIAAIREKVEKREAVRNAHRARWSVLMDLLATKSPVDLAVQNIEGRGYNARIRGVCLRPELANELAASLNHELIRLGWRVQPPTKEALQLVGDGGPWNFELTLEDVPISGKSGHASPSKDAVAGTGGVR